MYDRSDLQEMQQDMQQNKQTSCEEWMIWGWHSVLILSMQNELQYVTHLSAPAVSFFFST